MPRVTHAAPPSDVARRAVARDTATILVAVALALGIAQLAGLAGAVEPDPTQPGSEEVIGVASGEPLLTLPPLATIGQIVNPSAGLDATPTPIPIITLGPPSPSPSETPRVTPGSSLKPTAKPTVKPTIKPSTSVPPPPLVAAMSCDPPPGDYAVGVSGTCIAVVTGAVGAVTYTWSIDNGASGGSAVSEPFGFPDNGTHSIALTVSDGLGRTSDATTNYWNVTLSSTSP
jgi:hypothetical protein